MSEKSLTKVGVVEILGQQYDVARNGHFHLVSSERRDAYGRPVSDLVDLRELVRDTESIDVSEQGGVVGVWESRNYVAFQDLLDALGEKMVALQAQRDMRRGEVES